MDDPEGQDLFFVVEAPSTVTSTVDGTVLDFGRLFYSPFGLSDVRVAISDGEQKVLSELEASTLDYDGWDSEFGSDNDDGNDPGGVHELLVDYWAFNTENDADAFAGGNATDVSSTEGQLSLYVIAIDAY